jgi:hypothetical protein
VPRTCGARRGPVSRWLSSSSSPHSRRGSRSPVCQQDHARRVDYQNAIRHEVDQPSAKTALSSRAPVRGSHQGSWFELNPAQCIYRSRRRRVVRDGEAETNAASRPLAIGSADQAHNGCRCGASIESSQRVYPQGGCAVPSVSSRRLSSATVTYETSRSSTSTPRARSSTCARDGRPLPPQRPCRQERAGRREQGRAPTPVFLSMSRPFCRHPAARRALIQVCLPTGSAFAAWAFPWTAPVPQPACQKGDRLVNRACRARSVQLPRPQIDSLVPFDAELIRSRRYQRRSLERIGSNVAGLIENAARSRWGSARPMPS